MKKFNNVLAYVDAASEDLQAVEIAARLVRPASGGVVAVKVLDLSLAEGHDADTDGWRRFCTEVVTSERQLLEARLSRLSPTDARLTARIGLGRPSLELIRDVLQFGHDLVVKVAAGATGGRRIAFGSTGLHLVRKCPAPVWLLPRAPLPARRILAAIHPGIDGDEARYALSQRLLRHASALATSLQAELHVVHVHEPARSRLKGGSLSSKLLHRIGLTEQHVADRLRRLLEELPQRAQLHLLHGEPQAALPELALSLEAHTLVMGSVGRGDVPGLLIGDLAEDLLLRVDCGVFCAKPAGFETPVGARDQQRLRT